MRSPTGWLESTHQHPSLVVGKENPFSTHLLHQHSNLGILKSDDLLLAAVHPAGEDQIEQLPGLDDKSYGIATTNERKNVRGSLIKEVRLSFSADFQRLAIRLSTLTIRALAAN